MEARIYKPKRHRNGKRTTGRLYRARVKLTGDNKVRDISLGVSDKQVAQQKLNKLIQELEHESAGLIPAKAEREAAQSPLLDLISEYVNELTVLGRSADHLRHVNTRLRRLVRECRWTRLADVTPASFQSWRKDQTTKAPKTLNEYLATLSAFWTWLRKQSRVTVNPFELVERTDTRGKERVQRRALSDAQAIQLLQVAGKNQLAYMLPLYAGLRRNEAKTLHWSDLVLGDNGGLLRLHAAVNKNRKEQSLPLHRDLAKALQQQKPADCKANDLVLVNGVPKMKEFRQDLKKAGIPFLDERGHRMDYHALRTTFITRLSTMKVHPRLAMELARHSDMRLTMKTYTDAGQLPLREVMDTLPSFGADSRIDSRNLGPTGQTVSRPVTETREFKTENIVANKGGSHDLTLAVATCHSEQQSGVEGVRIPLSPPVSISTSLIYSCRRGPCPSKTDRHLPATGRSNPPNK
ncbi:MAG: tyrosine-type recombinase/integrase [Verrucomicrobiia bacterium]